MTTSETTNPVVENFNRDNMVGAFVRYWTGFREGKGKVSTTRSVAQMLGGHTLVVWVDGESSCIYLTHVEPIPHQPDGIDEDDGTGALPDPVAAADRVQAYISEFGDGLYDVVGGAPLYGRDLEAVCRAVVAVA